MPEVLVIGEDQTLVVEAESPTFIVVTEPRTLTVENQVVEYVEAAAPTQFVEVTVQTTELIEAFVEVVQILEVAVQGPPGPPGSGTGSGTATPPTSRTLTWAAGRLTGVTYADGRSKAMTYTGEQLTRVDRLTPSAPTQRADLAYNPDGSLVGITESLTP